VITSILAYGAIYVAAIVEGEIYYITQCVAVRMGKLNWLAVLIAGALGGSTGDQLWFYLLRGRLGWLDRYPRLAKYHESVRARVSANENLMVLASRFLPGLRTAIPIACAYAGVGPLRFSLLNLVSAFAWAGAIMLAVAKLGPDALSAFGLKQWWGPLIPAALVLLFFRWLARPSRKT
jgi:membrane protein DedA with SNARE-associated domain